MNLKADLKFIFEKIKSGELHDTVLDWEDSLPSEEMIKSELNCKQADLILCLGTTLQILPVGGYPLLAKKNNGKIVIVNLQETRIDNRADLIINSKLDLVFQMLMENFFAEEIPRIEGYLSKSIQINLRAEKESEDTKDQAKYLVNVSNVVVNC
jgi:thiamine pyrophosphate-dependent acetolactate synthase large subunit-like protein